MLHLALIYHQVHATRFACSLQYAKHFIRYVCKLYICHMSAALMRFYCSVLLPSREYSLSLSIKLCLFIWFFWSYSSFVRIQMEGILNYARRPLLFLTLKIIDDNKCTHLFFLFSLFSFSLILSVLSTFFPYIATFYSRITLFGYSVKCERHLFLLLFSLSFFSSQYTFLFRSSNVTVKHTGKNVTAMRHWHGRW